MMATFMLEEMEVDPKTFDGVTYVLYGTIAPELVNFLDTCGAQSRKYASLNITHLIAGKDYDKNLLQLDHEIWDIPIVNELWVLFSAKSNRALPVTGFDIDLDENKLFSGKQICSSGLRKHDLQVLWANVNYYGGQFAYWLDIKCDFLVTAKCYGPKYTLAKENEIKIVTPDFITDCIKAGKILDWELYHPDLLVNVEETMKISDEERDAVISKIVNDNIIFQSYNKMTYNDRIEFTREMVDEVRRQNKTDILFIDDDDY